MRSIARRFTVPPLPPNKHSQFFSNKNTLLFVTLQHFFKKMWWFYIANAISDPWPGGPGGWISARKGRNGREKGDTRGCSLKRVRQHFLLGASMSIHKPFICSYYRYSSFFLCPIPTSWCPWPLGITHHLVFVCRTSRIADVGRCHGNLYFPPLPRCLRRPLTQLVVCWVLMAARVRWTPGCGHGLQKASQQYVKSYKDS